MATKVGITWPETGRNLYARIRGLGETVYDFTGNSFVTFAAADVVKYGTALTEIAGSGEYQLDIAGLHANAKVAGTYRYQFFLRATAAQLITDILVGEEVVIWDGAALVDPEVVHAAVVHVDYGLAKLVRSTTPANTLSVDASHRGLADLVSILGTALTETGGGYLAAAFKKFFDKATPTGTINSLPAAAAGAALGLPLKDADGFLSVSNLPVSPPSLAGGLPTVNASNQVAGVSGNVKATNADGAALPTAEENRDAYYQSGHVHFVVKE
jgi:hypothetical protein